jgi:hypothetical protein
MELDGIPGVRFSFRSLLERRISLLQIANSIALKNSPLPIWLASDGTNFNRIPAIVLGFKVIGDDLESPAIQQLTIATVPENYDNMKAAFEASISEIRSTKSIIVNDVYYDLDYTQGGDLKNLNCGRGLVSNNGNKSCLWCLCHKNCRFRTDLEWSVTDPAKGIFKLVNA